MEVAEALAVIEGDGVGAAEETFDAAPADASESLVLLLPEDDEADLPPEAMEEAPEEEVLKEEALKEETPEEGNVEDDAEEVSNVANANMARSGPQGEDHEAC